MPLQDVAARKQDYLSSPNRTEIKVYEFSQNSSLLKANVILGLPVDAPWNWYSFWFHQINTWNPRHYSCRKNKETKWAGTAHKAALTCGITTSKFSAMIHNVPLLSWLNVMVLLSIWTCFFAVNSFLWFILLVNINITLYKISLFTWVFYLYFNNKSMTFAYLIYFT